MQTPISKDHTELRKEVTELNEKVNNMMTMMSAFINKMMPNNASTDVQPDLASSQSKQPADTKESNRKRSLTFSEDNSSINSLLIVLF